MGDHPTQELNESGNFECLRHSNWTICSPLSPSCWRMFPAFPLSYLEANNYHTRGLLTENGESPSSRIEWVETLTACWRNFPTFPLSCCEANSNCPRGLITSQLMFPSSNYIHYGIRIEWVHQSVSRTRIEMTRAKEIRSGPVKYSC